MIKIIHLSDLHYRLNLEEEQELVLSAFFKDLEKQIQSFNRANVFIAFSGDVVMAGGNVELYEGFLKQFDDELNKLKIPKNQRICIPGNHDISQSYIKEKFIEHEGVIKLISKEIEFNNYISNPRNIFIDKFSNYNSFEPQFASFGIKGETISGSGFYLTENIGLYCLNSAICSSGGVNNINDKERLSIDTRSLQKWILSCNAKTKILVMHHSIDWLTDWAQIELKKILKNNFALCLSGHVHDQSVFHSFNKGSELIDCSAPPLLTNKKDNLGYSAITISDKGVLEIQYRQWTKNYSFVTGVNFSDTDDGKIIVNKEEVDKALEYKDEIANKLSQNLNEALRSFSSQPIVWVEPLISNNKERSNKNNHENEVSIKDIISSSNSLIIKAPPQFGLTCLSHYLIKEAWQLDLSVWLYLDSNLVRSHTIGTQLKKELENRNVSIKRVSCIILDGWTNYTKDSHLLIKNLCELHPDIRIIIMQTIDENKFISEPNTEIMHREFDLLYLLALTRSHIRKVVSEYNDKRHIGEEDDVLNKVVSDLEVLNIHRTPYNCLTLLKVAEKYYDESPVNRTKMLEKVLFLLFDTDDIPNYKSKPDLTDCEYVLGFFCEKMIREDKYYFSREDFLKDLRRFCSEKLIGLEIETVFDVLFSNYIIIKRDGQYVFKSVFWVYYFAAQRMHHSDEFAKYMFEEKRYISFPEMIEFYTGIDRRRKDALVILTNDLKNTCDIVFEKVGLPDGMDPYKLAKWEPSPESLKRMQSLISENVKNSSLPDSVKDSYADRTYNPIKPYDQSIHKIFHDYSLFILMQSVKSSSRALRNSDYVESEIKRDLLKEITRGWEQISKVLFALTPRLAFEGEATFEGQGFILLGNFGDTLEKKIDHILSVIPNNVVSIFKDDIYSYKIGPLLYDQITNETNELKKLQLILLIIFERPPNWKTQVQKYIISINKNSFYP